MVAKAVCFSSRPNCYADLNCNCRTIPVRFSGVVGRAFVTLRHCVRVEFVGVSLTSDLGRKMSGRNKAKQFSVVSLVSTSVRSLVPTSNFQILRFLCLRDGVVRGDGRQVPPYFILQGGVRHVCRHRNVPPRDASPTILQLPNSQVHPAFNTASVAHVAMGSIFQIMDVTNTDSGLIGCVHVIFQGIITRYVFYVGEDSRMGSIRPRLVQVGFLIPRATVVVAKLSFGLTMGRVRHFLMFQVFNLLVGARGGFPKVSTVRAMVNWFVNDGHSINIRRYVYMYGNMITSFLIAVHVVSVGRNSRFGAIAVVPL